MTSRCALAHHKLRSPTPFPRLGNPKMSSKNAKKASAPATPSSSSPLPAARKTAKAATKTETPPPEEQEQEPVFPPEVFLLLMKQLEADKSLRTLLNLGLASKACAGFALPIIRNCPRRLVFLAIQDIARRDANGGFVRGAFTRKELAQVCLEGLLDLNEYDFFDDEDDEDFEPIHRDFEEEPYVEDWGEGGIKCIIKRYLLLGPLQHEDHVWILYSDSNPKPEDKYNKYENRVSFEGVFTSEEEARKEGYKRHWACRGGYSEESAKIISWDGLPVYRCQKIRLRG